MVAFPAFSQEVISDLSEKSTTVLNEELRKNRTDISEAESRITETESDISDINSRLGYSLVLGHQSFDPADSTTYYYGGMMGSSAVPFAARRRIYIPKSGTIKSAYVFAEVGSTLASTETATMYLRLNNTTDTLVSSAIQFNTTSQSYSATNLSIAVTAGDYLEVKLVTPAWATNPLAIRTNVSTWIET